MSTVQECRFESAQMDRFESEKSGRAKVVDCWKDGFRSCHRHLFQTERMDEQFVSDLSAKATDGGASSSFAGSNGEMMMDSRDECDKSVTLATGRLTTQQLAFALLVRRSEGIGRPSGRRTDDLA
ncbi:unnamed protein product [Protopolystoma xenopodis]|uniref:Uncharacterized protein n=1 Tax=Protopolystoma xenopodis TaxID=117903 RepID=A0A3S5BEN8_9PLAT|nr:unnamed protein product [Protopolystoma xenopodis]